MNWTVFGAVMVLVFSLLSRGARAADDPSFLAHVFDQESKKQKLLFTYQHDSEQKGDLRVATNTYKNKDGGLAAIETVEFTGAGDAEKVVHYHMSQKQLEAEGDVKIEDGRVKFTYTKGGSTKSGDEKLTDDFVVGPSVSAYLLKRWNDIASGGKVKVRFAVPDRAETVGFEYFKDHEETIDGNKTFAIKMKPSSFLIAALVKPLYFFYSTDGKKLYEVRGRTQVKQMVDGSWHDLDAVTVYDYAAGSTAASVSSAPATAVGAPVPAASPGVQAPAGGNSK